MDSATWRPETEGASNSLIAPLGRVILIMISSKILGIKNRLGRPASACEQSGIAVRPRVQCQWLARDNIGVESELLGLSHRACTTGGFKRCDCKKNARRRGT